MQKYEEPLTLGPSWFEMIFGLSNRKKEINERIITERQIEHYNIVREQMGKLCEELDKDYREAHYLKIQKLSSLNILDSDRKTPRSSDITKIIIEFDIFLSSINGKCEMIYETVDELRKLIPKKDLVKIEKTINSFEGFAEDIQMKLEKMKEELTNLLEKSLIEEEELLKIKQKEYEEAEKHFKRAPKIFGDFKQTYVKESVKLPGPNPGPKPGPKSSPNPAPKSVPKPVPKSGPKLIPSKYFRDIVLKYTGQTMTSPVADSKEIRKYWKKVSVHIQPNGTKYNKLSDIKKKEAEEIFKKITNEKDLYVAKGSGKRKKTSLNRGKNKKKTKRAKKKS